VAAFQAALDFAAPALRGFVVGNPRFDPARAPWRFLFLPEWRARLQ